MKTYLTVVRSIVLTLFVAFGVAASAQAQTYGLSLNPTSFNMYVGETKTVSVLGTNSYYIGGHSNMGITSAAVSTDSSNTVVVTAFAAGTDSVSICSSVTGSVSCGSFTVTVLQTPNTNTNTSTTQSATISFSPNQVTVNVGQSQTATVTGSGNGSYYVSDGGTGAANASVSSNIITIVGVQTGGTNIKVCQIGGVCGNIYAYVPLTTANTQATQNVQTAQQVPVLSAFYVASSDMGGDFLGKGAILTIKFNTTSDISQESLKVAGQTVSVTGTGSGPYGGAYTMTGNEQMPLQVSVDFSNSAGSTGHGSFAIGGNPSAATSAASTVSAAVASFTRYLQNGSKGADVTALQNLLKRLGIYSGPVTGTFGPLTETAVKRYQTQHGLDSLGAVGPATRAALNKGN